MKVWVGWNGTLVSGGYSTEGGQTRVTRDGIGFKGGVHARASEPPPKLLALSRRVCVLPPRRSEVAAASDGCFGRGSATPLHRSAPRTARPDDERLPRTSGRFGPYNTFTAVHRYEQNTKHCQIEFTSWR